MRCDVLKRSVAFGFPTRWAAGSCGCVHRSKGARGGRRSAAGRWECPSPFYKWKAGELPPREARRQRLKAEVARLFARREGKDGSPRITAALRAAGWRVSENTVAALMREQGWPPPRQEGRRGTTGRGRAGGGRGPDQAPVPAAGIINRKWYGDGTRSPPGRASCTSIRCWTWGRAGSAGTRSASTTTPGWLRRAGMAVAVRGGSRNVTGVISTPTRAASTPPASSAILRRLGIRQSMGRPGSALDNAVIESWHSTLEWELRTLQKFATRRKRGRGHCLDRGRQPRKAALRAGHDIAGGLRAAAAGKDAA